MNEKSIVDVLCIGTAVFDITMYVGTHPGEDEKCFAEDMISCGGGPASNAAVTVSKLGGTSALLGYLGRDFGGDQHFRELADSGVDISLIKRGDRPTPVSAILVKPDGKRTLINYKKNTPPLSKADVSRTSKFRVMLFDGHEPDISPRLAKAGKEFGIPIILDAGSLHRGTQELISLADYCIASEKFCRQFSGKEDPREGIASLARSAQCAVVTLGEKGCIWKDSQGEGTFPAFEIEAADTTGAGDIFHGAFAYGLAYDFGFTENIRFASAAAALGCTRKGGRTSIPDKKEVENFLKHYSRK